MTRKSGWLWPWGLLATGFASATVLLFRGCWHRQLSWPVAMHQHSYQVCLGCGIKRLFDEKAFRGYGPYHYDLTQLIAWDESRRREESHKAHEITTIPTASDVQASGATETPKAS